MLVHNGKIKSTFIFFIFCLVYGIITVNLYFTQIVQREHFQKLAQRQYKVTIVQQPPRGIIYDRHKKPIALNKDSIAAFILPHKIENPIALKKFLQTNFPQAYERLQKKDAKYFMYVKRKLTQHEINLIEQSNITDIKFIKEPNRFYPLPCLGTMLGITDIDNKGISGLELHHNELLSGAASTYILEKDARSSLFYFQKEVAKEGKAGQSLTLTIDSDLQFLAHEELVEFVHKLQAKEGSVLIMDGVNGDILAMTSYPDFNPNDVTNLNMEQTKNKLITESYELGSVMKIHVALALLSEGVVTIDELIDCENSKETVIDGMHFTTVHPDGIIPFSKVLVDSNNIGMVKVTKRLGPKLIDHYKRMGFGKKTGIEFPGEQAGYVNPAHKWSKRSIISLSFGYEITATLLQLAAAAGIIANNGCKLTPRLLLNAEPKAEQERLYPEEVIQQIKAIMKETVDAGTAKRARIKGYTIMGKTGTANMVIDGKYSKEHNVYTFEGIIEKDNYKRIIITFIKDSPLKHLYAANTTAPLFEKIAEKMLIHEKIVI